MIASQPAAVSTHGLDYIKSIRNELALSGILLLGFLLRVYHLGYESIWLDEAFSIRLSKLGVIEILKGSIHDTHPPLYHTLLHFWIRLFGYSEFSTRFLSLLFGLLAIFMIYKLGTLLFNKEAGLLSSLLLSLSVFQIHYSQETRMYSLLSLLTLVSMYYFIKYIKERNLSASAGYLLPSTLLVYTHVYGLFIVFAQNLYIISLYLFDNKDERISFKKWILLQLLLFVLFSPWIIVIIYQIMNVKTFSWIPVPSLMTPVNYLKVYSGSNLFYLFIFLSFLSIISYKKVQENFSRKNLFGSFENYKWNIYLSNTKEAYFLLLWLLIPNLIPLLISRISTPVYWDRYTIGASIAFYLLAAAGIKKLNYKSIKTILLSLIIILSSLNIGNYFSNTFKEEWRDAVKYIDNNARQSDLVLFNAGFNKIPFNYYSRKKNLVKEAFPENTRDVDKENIKKLSAVVQEHKRVWIILSKSGDADSLIKNELHKSYTLSYHKKYLIKSYTSQFKSVGIEVDLFEKN